MNKYVERVIDSVCKKDADKPEFIQAVKEVFSSVSNVIDAHPEFEKVGLLERLVEPDRAVSFRITWVDDSGRTRVNRGYRVQFNNAIGPYKGGLRFHPSVNPSLMHFLAFEQTYKNALTGLNLGGAKGGSDFDPRDKSNWEIMRFCQAFMTEFYRYIGDDTDVPAGDIGVGGREIGYLYGQYKRITGIAERGVLSGKNLSYGGSLLRPEATGYGAVYYLRDMLAHDGRELRNKTVVLSGYGNVSWGVIRKLAELGAVPLTVSGSAGYVYDRNGITDPEKINYIYDMRVNGVGSLSDYAEKFGAEFHAGQKPWAVKADIVMPCATQNEVDIDDAKLIVANGTRYYAECSNMPTTNEAVDYLLANGVTVGPAKAVNAGGVAVSGLEMAQNSMRIAWSEDKVDSRLYDIMHGIYTASVAAAEEHGMGYNLVAGANIAGFMRVAESMCDEGIY